MGLLASRFARLNLLFCYVVRRRQTVERWENLKRNLKNEHNTFFLFNHFSFQFIFCFIWNSYRETTKRKSWNRKSKFLPLEDNQVPKNVYAISRKLLKLLKLHFLSKNFIKKSISFCVFFFCGGSGKFTQYYEEKLKMAFIECSAFQVCETMENCFVNGVKRLSFQLWKSRELFLVNFTFVANSSHPIPPSINQECFERCESEWENQFFHLSKIFFVSLECIDDILSAAREKEKQSDMWNEIFSKLYLNIEYI